MFVRPIYFRGKLLDPRKFDLSAEFCELWQVNTAPR